MCNPFTFGDTVAAVSSRLGHNVLVLTRIVFTCFLVFFVAYAGAVFQWLGRAHVALYTEGAVGDRQHSAKSGRGTGLRGLYEGKTRITSVLAALQ